MLKRVAPRALRYFLVIFLSVFISLSPLAHAQADLSTPFYDASAGSCSTASSAPVSDSAPASISLDDIAKEHPEFHSGVVKQIGGPVLAKKNSDQSPPAVASVLKLIIADLYLRSDPDLDKSVIIKQHQVYDPAHTTGTAYAPKAGQSVKLKNLLTEMLSHSSDTAPNVLIDELGGLDKTSAEATKVGYTDTTIGSYYNSEGKPTKSINRSTADDLTKAMENLYTTTGANYEIAQEALRQDEFDFGLKSEANKWGGTSLVTANSAVFAVGQTEYIITLYYSSPWDGPLPSQNYKGKESEAVGWLRAASNKIVDQLSQGGPAASTSAAGASSDLTFKGYPDQVDSVLVSELKTIAQTIKPNIAEYKAAGSRWGIPWQAIAATHWREGSAGARKSMVNGRSLPAQSDLGGKEYLWGSASVNDTQWYSAPNQNTDGNPSRRFYGKSVQDIDYATWLLIQHGVRPNANPQFNQDPNQFIAKAQAGGLTKDEWVNTWGAYLGSKAAGYGNFGRDSGSRMGAGAIMAYLGGLVEKPPVPSVNKYPGTNDSDYDKVAAGVDGSITPSGGSVSDCTNGNQDDSSGIVSTDGYSFPIAAKKKSDYNTFGALSAVPCNNSGGCHHWEQFSSGGYAFDLGVKGYGPDRSENAPVYAISDGEIKHVSYERNGNPCNQIEFSSSLDGYVYWYGHLAFDQSIKAGQQYKAGERIGKVGPTVCADNTAPHLHIDRGSPKGQDGGSECCRDKGIIPLINNLYEGLPD